MKAWKLAALMGLFAGAASFGAGGEAQEEGDKKKEKADPAYVLVDGEIRDGKNVLLEGATVQAYDIQGRPVGASFKTKKDGQYNLKIAKKDLPGGQAAIGLITYDHPLWHPQLVEILSGIAAAQKINKLLPIPEGPFDYLEIVRQIQIYDLLISLTRSSATDPDGNTARLIALFRQRVSTIPHPLALRTDEGFVKAMTTMSPAQRQVLTEKLTALYPLYGLTPLVKPPALDGLPCPPSIYVPCYPYQYHSHHRLFFRR